MRKALLIAALFLAVDSSAHPGSAIAVSNDGIIYLVDTGAGVFAITPDGRTTRRDGPAFHWLAYDPDNRFSRTPWPSPPGAEFRSAGTSPNLVLSSDFPVTIAGGTFYWPDGSGERIRIVAIAPSGARSIRATLPPIQRGGQTITWINGLAPGPDGSLYYSEDRAIRKIDGRGNVSTIANNIRVPSCAAIPGTEQATGPYLRGLAVAADRSILVAAAGCGALLRVSAKGEVRTVLSSTPPWSPTAVAISRGDVYVLEYLHTASDERREWIPQVRKISRSGTVSTIPARTRP